MSSWFSGVAREYATYRPRYPAELFAALAQLAPHRELAWDCGAGSGQASVELAPHFARVVATDISEQQVAAAEPHARVEYRVASAEQSGLANASVALVTVANLTLVRVVAFTPGGPLLSPGSVCRVVLPAA
jgi:hypothetical protein